MSASCTECNRDSRFILYARRRADIREWLAPLLNMRLLCHCGREKCHANDIAELIVLIFGSHDALQTASPVFSLPGTCDIGNGVVPFDAGPVDATVFGNKLEQYVLQQPSAPSWPDEWTSLVENIRERNFGLFWEIFAGRGSFNCGFSIRGRICAPPVDVAYCSDLNILNPLFLAIIVGIILEGRITLVGIDPPFGRCEKLNCA